MSDRDKILIRKRFSRHLAGYDRLACVQRTICDRLAGKLAETQREGNEPPATGTGAELGAGTGFLTTRLFEYFPGVQWYVNDLVPETETYIEKIRERFPESRVAYLWGDAETIGLPDKLTLLLSASAMQWFESPETFIRKAYGKIAPGGWFAFSLYGEANFREIREASEGLGLTHTPFMTVAGWCRDAGFEIVHGEEYRETMIFDTPADVLRHVKETGVNGDSRSRWTRSDLERFCGRYRDRFSAEGGVTLTYHPLLLICRKPE